MFKLVVKISLIFLFLFIKTLSSSEGGECFLCPVRANGDFLFKTCCCGTLVHYPCAKSYIFGHEDEDENQIVGVGCPNEFCEADERLEIHNPANNDGQHDDCLCLDRSKITKEEADNIILAFVSSAHMRSNQETERKMSELEAKTQEMEQDSQKLKDENLSLKEKIDSHIREGGCQFFHSH